MIDFLQGYQILYHIKYIISMMNLGASPQLERLNKRTDRPNGEVAHKLKRNSVGIEIVSEYYKLAKKRTTQYQF